MLPATLPVLADISAAPVLGLLALGFFVTLAGHAFGSRLALVLGILVLFTATAALMVGGFRSYQTDHSDCRGRHAPAVPC